jgi:GNAT superfamily N-acetyltransferase
MTALISLRTIRRSDCSESTRQFAEQGWEKPESQFHAYCAFQESGAHDVLIAELDGAFTGYLTIQWESDYLPFREQKVPEVVDFNVLKKYQGRGIGTRLMDEATV